MAAGIRIDVDIGDFDAALAQLRPLLDLEVAPLMEAIGALGESQTRRRITDEKTAPDGSAWPPNAEGTSILLRTGEHLLGSIAYTASGDQAQWGASWEYAHVHQDGATIKPQSAPALAFSVGGKSVHARQVTIPARPFVGLSADNWQELRELVTDYVRGQL